MHKENAVIIRELKATTREIKAFNKDGKAFNASLKSLLARQAVDRRETKRMLKDQERRHVEHDKWMRDHGVRLRSQYKMIRK